MTGTKAVKPPWLLFCACAPTVINQSAVLSGDPKPHHIILFAPVVLLNLQKLRDKKTKMSLVTYCRWMINCSEISVMITELSSQVTLIRFFILLHAYVISEQIHCNSTGESTCKSPLFIITNRTALKTTHKIHGLLKQGTVSV